MTAVLQAVFFLLLAGAILPPFVPLAGPFSLDDLLPLVAVGGGLLVMPLFRGSGRPNGAEGSGVPRRWGLDGVVLGFVIVVAVGWLSAAASAETMGAFLRLAGRGPGRALFYLALVVTVRFVARDSEGAQRALKWIAGAATLEAVFGLWAYATEYQGPYNTGVVPFSTWSVLSGHVRLQGTFGGEKLPHEAMPIAPNFLAAYLVMSILVTFGLSWVSRGWTRVLWAWSVALQMGALYVTFTRAALVALSAGVVAFGFFVGRRRWAAVLLGVALTAGAISPQVRAKFFGEKHDRWALYWASWQITGDHPVFGVGDGNYDRVLGDHPEYYDTPYGVATSTSHNSVLLAAAHAGLLGGAAHGFLYVMVIAMLVWALWRAERSAARGLVAAVAAAFVGFLAQDQVNNLAFVPKVATQVWFIIALAPWLSGYEAARPVDRKEALRS